MNIEWGLFKGEEGLYELTLVVKTSNEAEIAHIKRIQLSDNVTDSFIRLCQIKEVVFDQVLVSSTDAAIAEVKRQEAEQATQAEQAAPAVDAAPVVDATATPAS